MEDAENKTKEALKALQTAKDKIDNLNDHLKHERETFENLKSKINTAHFPTQVILNIGGKKFSTSVDTMKKDPNNFFGAMFSGLHEVTPDKDGAYFIDRDGKYFRYILNYLRTGEVLIPHDDKILRKELMKEAEFYQIKGILRLFKQASTPIPKPPVTPPPPKPQAPFPGSSIIEGRSSFSETLNQWVGYDANTNWKLLYKGTRDGFTGPAFHSRCDNKGPTYTIFKLGANIFGGYNPHSWSISNNFSPGSGSFLFVLNNSLGNVPTQFQNQNTSYGPYNHNSYGPTFGGGHDIFLNLSNPNRVISFNTPSSYGTPSHTVFCSSACGVVDEVEVYGGN